MRFYNYFYDNHTDYNDDAMLMFFAVAVDNCGVAVSNPGADASFVSKNERANSGTLVFRFRQTRRTQNIISEAFISKLKGMVGVHVVQVL